MRGCAAASVGAQAKAERIIGRSFFIKTSK
jgi:hypothetical protein